VFLFLADSTCVLTTFATSSSSPLTLRKTMIASAELKIPSKRDVASYSVMFKQEEVLTQVP